MKRNRKGISALVASILLLLIVISLIGFVFGFFQRIFTTSQQSGEQGLNSTTGQLQTAIRIDNAQGSTLVIRNTGTRVIDNSTLVVYVNGVVSNCWWNVASLAPQTTARCQIFSCTTGQNVRVTTSGVSDSTTCG